jgi:Tol biopolymer transport system component
MRLLAAALAAGLVLAGLAFAATATTERVSVTPSGSEPDSSSGEPSVSADGNLVAYSSSATDIVPGVGDGHAPQIYVYNRTTGETKLASASSSGEPANNLNEQPAISADGRYVAFDSYARNLVPGGATFDDVYVKNLKTGELTRASVSSSGAAGNKYSSSPSISADGNVVTFSSDATNLTPVKTKSRRNEFVHFMDSGKTVQVNVSPKGGGGNGDCHKPSVSADGGLIAFASRGSNLVKGGSRGWQIFVRDLDKRKTSVVSLSSSGKTGNGTSSHPVISGDGRFVAFESQATNLVKGDTTKGFDLFLRDLTKRTTKRISVGANGHQANDQSSDASISNHGGYVAFYSAATNLTPGEGGSSHVFLYSSRGGKRLQQVDVSDAGKSGDRLAGLPAVSGDGRFVAFQSQATNLVGGPPVTRPDVYIRGPLH